MKYLNNVLYNTNKNIINYCLASLRLEAITKEYPDFNIEEKFKDESDIISKLNDNEWFKTNEDIKISKITNYLKKNEYLSKLPPEFPFFKDRHNFQGPKIVSQNDFEIFYNEERHKSLDKINFIFNELVLFFLASGFNGSYIFIDDFERIPDFQSERQKRDFAVELRTNLFDGNSENAKIGFYNLVLTLHAGVSRLIDEAWSSSGLERRSPITSISHNFPHEILFEKLQPEHSIQLISKYLNEFRINKNTKSSLEPFERAAIIKIGELSEFNAAAILKKANIILDKLLESDKKIIDIAFVEEVLARENKIETTVNKKITDEDSVDLLKKSNE